MKKLILLLAAFLFFGGAVQSQRKTVSGIVKDEKGEGVSFATITEAGTGNSVQADAAGTFRITVAEGSLLTITASGFTAQTLPVTGSLLNVALVRGNGQLTEVVVTALGQSRSKERLGYAATTFKSEDITRSVPVSPLDGLQGKVASAF